MSLDEVLPGPEFIEMLFPRVLRAAHTLTNGNSAQAERITSLACENINAALVADPKLLRRPMALSHAIEKWVAFNFHRRFDARAAKLPATCQTCIPSPACAACTRKCVIVPVPADPVAFVRSSPPGCAPRRDKPGSRLAHHRLESANTTSAQ